MTEDIMKKKLWHYQTKVGIQKSLSVQMKQMRYFKKLKPQILQELMPYSNVKELLLYSNQKMNSDQIILSYQKKLQQQEDFKTGYYFSKKSTLIFKQNYK